MDLLLHIRQKATCQCVSAACYCAPFLSVSIATCLIFCYEFFTAFMELERMYVWRGCIIWILGYLSEFAVVHLQVCVYVCQPPEFLT